VVKLGDPVTAVTGTFSVVVVGRSELPAARMKYDPLVELVASVPLLL
jgi:hypothetical protein